MAELVRLQRLQRALLPLARRRALLAHLAALDGASRLPHDLPDRLREITLGEQQAAARRQVTLNEVERLHRKIRDLDPRTELLEQEETISALHQRLGAYRQAKEDRPGLVEQMLCHRTEAEGLLRRAVPEVELAAIDTLKPLLARRQQIRKLANRYTALMAAQRHTERKAAGLEAEVEQCQGELQELPPAVATTTLATVVAAARKAGDLDETFRRLRNELRSLHVSSEAATARLGLWQGMPGELLALPLPGPETINRFADLCADQERQLREAGEAIRAGQHELDQVQSELRAMETTGAIPTEAELRQCRGRREDGWQLIRRAWLNREDVTEESRAYGANRDLSDAYEEAVLTTDEVSDRLRGEAERVHTYATRQAQAEKLAEQVRREQETVTALVARSEALDAEWCAVWQGCAIIPLSPREMRDWLDRAGAVRRQAEEIVRGEAETGPLAERIVAHRERLTAELAAVARSHEIAGEELEPLLSYSETVLEELAERSRRRETLASEFKRLSGEAVDARTEVAAGQTSMTVWQEEWTAAIQAPGMIRDADPADLTELLEHLAAAFARRDSAAGFQERLDAIDRHAADFDRDALSLVTSVAPELAGLPAEQAVARLQGLLTAVKNTASLLDSLRSDLTAATEELEAAHLANAQAEVSWEALLTQCGTPDRIRLQELAQQVEEYHRLRNDLEQVEGSLSVIAEGVSLDRLEELARETDPDTLPGRISTLERIITEETEPQVRAQAERKGAARTELDLMDGSARAAELAERAEAELARIRRLADRYLRHRLAGQMLRREIEQYRREHQDPVLALASRYFSELTRGSLAGLRTDVDDSGRPVLVGVTAGGSVKGVETMSSGTRDQLYLALRLATIDWRLQSHPPLPFIADDLLVNFDDDRSRATLMTLATLAERNQVILFTHHREIVRQARELGRPELVVVHELGAA